MNIGEKLKQRRKEFGMTQEEVATKLYVSRQAVSNWESGKNYPDLETIITLSDIYKISLDILLKGDRKMIKKLEKGIVYKYMYDVIAAAGLLAIAICLIVDFTINRTLTWSLIVGSSLLFTGSGVYTFKMAKTQKVLKTAVCLSVLVIPLLIGIQYSALWSGFSNTVWVWTAGVPLAILWLAISWGTYFIKKATNMNWFYAIALFCLFELVGSALTSYIVMGYHMAEFTSLNVMINAAASITIGIVFVVLGNRYREGRMVA